MNAIAGITQKSKFRLISLAVLVVLVGLIFTLVHKTPVPTAAPLQTNKPTQLSALQCAESLPTEELAGQTLMVGLTAAGMKEQALIFKQYKVGGAVLMTSPVNPYDGSIKAFKLQGGTPGIPLLISTDEEGGSVQRFSTLGVLPSQYEAAQQSTPSQARAIIAAHGAKLKSIGVDMVLAPVADVAPVNSESTLGDRVFSDDPQTVTNYTRAYVQGWEDAGLLPTLKHFPGLGSATGNTDYQPATIPPLKSLINRDFVPYRVLASSGTAVMVGSQNAPGWFNGPALFSPAVNSYLRNVLGYKDSLVITDSLNAAAVAATDNVSSAVVKALAAGNDMVLLVDTNVTNMTAAQNAAVIKDAETAVEKAVTSGLLTKNRLAQSFLRKLAAQKLAACSLADR